MPGEARGKVVQVDIEEEMKRSYIDYAMSVIVSRALPDVRDGLKPVHRRILYAMHEAGLSPDKPHKKSARVVGDVLGRYHPHGDAPVYEAMVRLAQDFATRYLLVDGHGNFGSIDGDPPAAMRYCVTGDTLVVTGRGLMRMDRLSPEGAEEISDRVLSMNGTVNTASRWFDCGSFPTRRVRTRRGYEVTGTMNHPLLACVPVKGGRTAFVWKTIKEIAPGDWLVLDRSEALWPDEPVDVRALYPDFPITSRVERHALPAILDEDLAFLLGALVAEGTFRKDVIDLVNVPGELADTFQEVWGRVFPTCRLHTFLREAVGYGRKQFLQMQVVSQQVVGFLHNLGLPGKSGIREIPEAVLRSPQSIAAAFLRGLYEGDGAVEQSGRSLLRVGLSAKNRTLLRQVQVLLLRFGIVCTLNHEASRGTYRLMIIGQRNLQAFADKIGFVSTAKQQALERALAMHSGRALYRKDFIPFLADYMRQNAGRGQREWLTKHNFDRPERLAAALPRLAGVLPADDVAHIEQIARANYLFDEVVSVEDAGEQRVYSVRVDSECHSFVANGFVNHNTEVRLAPLAMEMLRDLDKDTVDFSPNFDDTLKEPNVLPARFPNLLVNGSSGIAVGMATNIPPHNLGEVIDAITMMIDNPEVSLQELMLAVKGPDFPTGGLILGRDGIKQAYRTGRGIIKMRGKAEIETGKNGRTRIAITELPYLVNKARLIEKIAELVHEKKIEGIADLRDETDRIGLRIAIDLRREANPRVVLNKLYKFTQLQDSFGVIMLALVDGEPRVLDLRQMIYHYLEHQKQVIIRRSTFELARAEARAHILEGLRVALDNIDRVISLIRSSDTVEKARQGLMTEFGLSEKQAQAILDMRLQRLTGLERQKVDQEYEETRQTIEYLRAVLSSERMVLNIIKQELGDIKARYADARRTRIVQAEEELEAEDLIPEEDVVITLTHHGYIKRIPASTYRSQRRGGRGITGHETREDDFVEHVFITTTHHHILFFTTRGRAYRLNAHEVPEAGRVAKGTAIVNLLSLQPEEKVTAVIPVKGFAAGRFLVLATRRGVIKKTPIEEFSSSRRSGIAAIHLDEGDELIGVHPTGGDAEILLVTRGGMAIRFSEKDVRPTGRSARGVIGIRLEEGDEVVGMDTVREGAYLLSVTSRGYGKRTPIGEYRGQSRGGKGIRTMAVSQRNGSVVGFKVVSPGDELMLVSAEGILIRLKVDEVPVKGRYTQGVTLMRLEPGDSTVAVAQVASGNRTEG